MPEKPSDPPHFNPMLNSDSGISSRLSPFAARCISLRSAVPASISSRQPVIREISPDLRSLQKAFP